MTKAATKAEARRRKAGRPKHDGPREPGGRPSRAAIYEPSPVALMRCRVMNWATHCEAIAKIEADAKKNDGEMTADTAARLDALRRERNRHIRAAHDSRLGILAGRLLVAGRIDTDSFAAIWKLGVVWGRYLAAIDAPRPWPKGVSIVCEAVRGAEDSAHGEVGLSATEMTPEDIARVLASYDAAQARLAAMPNWERAMVTLGLTARDEIGPKDVTARMCVRMILGGREMARHFGLRA